MMMLKWFSQNCENTKYLLKTDDDMYINLSVLHQVVKSHDISHEGSDLLVGSLVCSALPIRDPGHKWYMSPDIWPQWQYPPYVQVSCHRCHASCHSSCHASCHVSCSTVTISPLCAGRLLPDVWLCCPQDVQGKHGHTSQSHRGCLHHWHSGQEDKY